MPLAEFARRMQDCATRAPSSLTLFLGAGCSKSSGIPLAGELVRDHWLPRLHKFACDGDTPVEEWIKTRFDDYDAENPAAHYGRVIDALFPQPVDRQEEIEKLCDNRTPAFGYAVLGRLMANEPTPFGPIITTNFDELISDGMYLYSEARPLVVRHESLAGFIRPRPTRPLVVKIHGDAQLAPMNTPAETTELAPDVQKQLARILHDSGLVFMGYGGADESISAFLERLDDDSLPRGVYWVNEQVPDGPLGEWLASRNAAHVAHTDFDEVMLTLFTEFGLKHPSEKRFTRIFENYHEQYKQVSDRRVAQPDAEKDEDDRTVDEAVLSAERRFEGEWVVMLEARRLQDSDSPGAERVYKAGIVQFPESVPLLSNFATFLRMIDADRERISSLYERALKIAPDEALVNGNYASFLHSIRRDNSRAKQLYERSLKARPDDPTTLGNYACFLANVSGDTGQARRTYERALKMSPGDVAIWGNYAGFLLANGQRAPGLAALDTSDALLLQGGERGARTEYHFEQQLENAFYRVMHDEPDGRLSELGSIRRLVVSGARSHYWDFDPSIRRAEKDGHPDAAWLPKLAAVINDREPVSALDDWPLWQQAGEDENSHDSE